MQIKLSFFGAARNVTGSRYLLEAGGSKILVDCGMHQERDNRERDWQPFPIPPAEIDAVLLTHAHLDHTGMLPKLVKEGFRGRVYCTDATADITKVILLDAGKLQEEDAEFKRKRHEREGRKGKYPEIPLYTQEDAKATFPLFSPIAYEQPVKLGDNIEAVFYDAGHVLGSANIKVIVGGKKSRRSILFSGDIGTPNRPILCDPEEGMDADYVLVESTYGDRTINLTEDVATELAEVINDTERAGGNIVIPSFALERAQDILYYINQLQMESRIPHLMVFLDSPMAVSITEIFEKHANLYDREMTELVNNHHSPFRLPNLKLIRTAEESKTINHIKGTAIIIAGSGMCNGGRVKHHLVANISRKRSTILFVGYQAVGTLGRSIVDGAKRVRILGQSYPVKAKIVQMKGFSAHADREHLLEWLTGFKRAPRRVFVIHGETEAAQSFAELVREKTGWNVTVPNFLESFTLD
ncbi:MAG: MBL fold metallo-hydrolase [Dehalococcoidales bacterium]|nr:MBL fold metallo-hydrolase [Dehalococcoidales bacterium]